MVRRVWRAVVVLVWCAVGFLGVGFDSPAYAQTFPDVRETDWFYGAVEALSQSGVVTGTSDGTFKPYDTVTRAQFAAMLARAIAPPATTLEPFEDVLDTDWYQAPVASLYAAGLLSGTSSTTFSAGVGIARQQAASLIMRSLAYRFQAAPQDGIELALAPDQVDTWLAGFRDRNLIAAIHRGTVANAYRLGVVEGSGDGWFNPLGTLTRAQAAGLLYRSLYQPLVPLATPPEPVSLVPQVTLKWGSTGDFVLILEQRLAALKYAVGSVDGVFDEALRDAVRAFQKVEGLDRDGEAGLDVWKRLETAATPTPRITASGNRVEVDLTRQVLLLINGNQVTKVLAVATGASGTRTPTGHYHIERKLPYWRQSSLGLLYKPSYFVGGIAIHGSYSIPPYPASHGCVRVPYWATDALYPQLPVGMAVDVYY
ncbi:MAG: S-layer homology domain-containing protein [Thermoleophilia bacterium]